ncbi:DMT family transporter [Jannaschia sp. LMIT008]|uniref:DMT family transporter n=1 Tax=Jannaschia maritima TaxID=3032585 RepID=UPI0028114C06|nr:DMT family transporter [Jannaschia sp. LMIT008]
MASLTFGLVAAFAWGLHDLCVRQVSQKTGIFASLVAVLTTGLLLAVPVGLWSAEAPGRADAYTLAIVSGVLFGLAGIAHYKAFSIGPVRLVAPIIGAYPILSVAWAATTGGGIAVWDWLAVFVVIAGVGYVAASADDGTDGASRGQAVGWSVAAGTLFAATFAIGQAASSEGGELALQAPTRLAALAVVVAVGLALRVRMIPGRAMVPLLALMGTLDAIALASVTGAGAFENPEYAAVAASTFGLVTVVLAALFLRERLKPLHWGAVVVVFGAIASLGL